MKTPLHLEHAEHASDALRHIATFGWLRAAELGRLMYKNDPHATKYAEKLLRKLLALNLLIPRPLPRRYAGNAYVLSKHGADLINGWRGWSSRDGHQSGKSWGKTSPSGWQPPTSWLHDLIATGVLTHLAARGFDVTPERVLRNHEPEANKHPDGIATWRRGNDPYSIWIEVENARKTGDAANQLVRALVGASRGKPPCYFDTIQDAPVRYGMVILDANVRDERGYNIDHWGRIMTRIGRHGLIAPVSLLACYVTLKGVGVEKISIKRIDLSQPPNEKVRVDAVTSLL